MKGLSFETINDKASFRYILSANCIQDGHVYEGRIKTHKTSTI